MLYVVAGNLDVVSSVAIPLHPILIRKMTDNWDKTSFILDGDYDEPGDEPEEGSYRDKLFELLEEILKRIERLERDTHRHRFQNPEYQEYERLKKKYGK